MNPPKLPLCAVAFSLLTSSCRTPGNTPESSVLEAGSLTVSSCRADRRIDDTEAGIDFATRELSKRDAYWLSLLSANAYARKEALLPELRRLGFTDAAYLDQDGTTRNFLSTGLDFPWASTQGFWAEAPGGVVLAFRGTDFSATADVMTDLWLAQGKLDGIGTEVIGKLDAATAANDAKAGEDILVHKGFWYGLDVVWKDVEARAAALYAKERPAERRLKMGLLDQWAKLLKTKGDEAAKAAVVAETDWRVDPNGKLNFLRQWAAIQGDARRLELFEFLDARWASKQTPLFLTGHSMGGSLATLAAYRLMKMGLNVRGLYTFGAPRAGNQAFVHDFRVLAYARGLKSKGTSHGVGSGGLQRFVNHLDVVARIPPGAGFAGVIASDEQAEDATAWSHASPMNYLTGSETPEPALWVEGDSSAAARIAAAKIPRFMVTLPLESWKQWGADHITTSYVQKLEKIAFGKASPCD